MKTPKQYISIPLNNDMTQIVCPSGDDFITYTIMGTGNNADFNDKVGTVQFIESEELLNFVRNPKAIEIFQQVQRQNIMEDFMIIAKEKNISLTSDELELLAEEFLKKYDTSSCSEYDQKLSLLKNYEREGAQLFFNER